MFLAGVKMQVRFLSIDQKHAHHEKPYSLTLLLSTYCIILSNLLTLIKNMTFHVFDQSRTPQYC
jgi:hypothetical protein